MMKKKFLAILLTLLMLLQIAAPAFTVAETVDPKMAAVGLTDNLDDYFIGSAMDPFSMIVGEKKELYATDEVNTDLSESYDFIYSWSSSNTNVVTAVPDDELDSIGEITAVAPGKATVTITLTVGEYVATSSVEVTVTVPSGSVAAIYRSGAYVSSHTTLADAVAAAQDGDTITLLADTSVDNPITVGSITVELDLNGHVVTNNAGAGVRAFELSNNTNFTVTGTKAGSGMVNSAAVDGKTYGFFRIYNKSNATLTVNGGNYIGNTDNGAFVRVSKSSSGSVVNLVNANVTTDWSIFDNTNGGAVTLTMTGGTYTQNNVVNGKGNLDSENKPVGAIHVLHGSTLNMTDVTLNSMGGTGVAVELQSVGTLKNCAITITGTENKWASCAVGIGGLSSVTLDGGTYTSGLHGVSYYTSGGNLIVKGGAVINGVADGIAYYYDTGYYSNLWNNYFPDGVPFYTTLIDGTIKNGLANYNGGGTNAAKNDSQLTVEGGEIDGDYTVGGTVDVYSITGGTFTEDPSDHVAEGYKSVDNGDGTWTVRAITYVAQIGNAKYETLAKAVEAVPTNGTATTIEMIADETIDGNAGVTIAAGKNIVLDLNGYTVKNAVNEDKASQVILNKGTLTIQDTSKAGTGKLTNAVKEGTNPGEWWSTPQYNYVTNVITNSGTLNVVSGTIRQTAAGSICYAIDNNNTSYDAIVNISGGTIMDDHGTVIRMFCNSTAKENEINISGGTVVTTGKAAIWTQLPGGNPASMKKAKLNITDGTITGGTYAWYDYSYGDGWNAVEYSISGGRFNGVIESKEKTGFVTGGIYSDEPDADYIAEGYKAVDNGDGTWTVRAYNAVAQIDDVKYESLADAIAAVPKDGTETTITMLANSNEGNISVNSGRNIVLDLGTHTVTPTFLYVLNGKLTAKNGTIANTVYVYPLEADKSGMVSEFTLESDAAIKAKVGNSVVLYNLNDSDKGYDGTINIAGTLNGNIWVMGNIKEGDSVINFSGTIESEGSGVGIALNGNATVNVTDGTIAAKDSVADFTGIEVRAGNLNVSGGTITGKGVPVTVTANGSGTTSTGAGIAVAQHTTKLPINVNIYGGTISGYSAFYESNPQNNEATDIEKIKLSISGGSFTATQGGTQSIVAVDTATIGRFITGGIYSTEPDEEYIATGYAAKDVDSPAGYYEIVKSTGTAVDTTNGSTTGTQYDSIPTAVKALVTDDGVEEITTGADAVIGSVTIESGSKIAVADNADKGTKEGVTVTEVTITKNEDSSTAYAVTTEAGSTLATTELGNGMDSNANPSNYVTNVASMIADKVAVAASTETVDADLEVDLKLDVVADQMGLSGNTVTYDVSLQGVFTVNGMASDAVEIANSDLATGASFTFKVKAPEGAKLANVVHRWTEDPTYGTGSETFENLVVDANGYVTITLMHFSEIDVTGLTQYEGGDNTAVNSVYRVYMNLQDGLYLTYQIYVGDSETTTVVLSNGGTEYEFNLSSATSFEDVQSAAFNTAMRKDVVNNGYFIARYKSTQWYYITVSNYPNYMDNAVTLKLTDGSATRALYQNGGTTNGITNKGTVLYSTQNNVFSYTMLAFLNSTKNSSDAKTKALSEVLISYYEAAFAQYGH